MAVRIKRDLFTGELVEEEYTPSETGRSIIAREPLPYGRFTVMGRADQSSISHLKPHVSKALGVHPKQAASFNKKLRDLGINDAYYSDKSGFLISESRMGRAAAYASRGMFDRDAQSGPEMQIANAIGF